MGVELLLQPNHTKAGKFRKTICLFLPMFKVSNVSLRSYVHVVMSYYVSLRFDFYVVMSYYVSLRSQFRVVMSYYVSLCSDFYGLKLYAPFSNGKNETALYRQ